MSWNKWIRQIHRWLSIAFTAAVIVNGIAVAEKKYTASLGLLAVVPLALQFFTGMYLFVLPMRQNGEGRLAPTKRGTDQVFVWTSSSARESGPKPAAHRSRYAGR